MAMAPMALRPPTEEEILAQYGGTLIQEEDEILRQYGGSIGGQPTAPQRRLPPGVPGMPGVRVEGERPWEALPPMVPSITGAPDLDRQIAAGAMQGLSGLANLVSGIANWASGGEPSLASATYKEIGDYARKKEQEFAEAATGLAGGRTDLPSGVLRAGTGAVVSLPPYIAATTLAARTLGGGPSLPASMLGMGAVGAAQAGGQEPLDIAKSTIENGLLGGVLHLLGPFKRPIRIVGQASIDYARLRLQGVDHDTALQNAIAGGMLGAMGGPGELGLRDVPKEVVSRLPASWQKPLPTSLGVVRPVFKGQLTPQEEASNAWMREQGIQLPPSLETGSETAALLEGTTKAGPGGGYAREQAAAIGEKLGEVGRAQVEGITSEPYTTETAGAELQTKLAAGLEGQQARVAGQVFPEARTPEQAGATVIEKGQAKIREHQKTADENYGSAWEVQEVPDNYELVPSGKLDAKGKPIMEQRLLPIDRGPLQKMLRPIVKRYEYTLTETEQRASPALHAMRQIVNGPRYADVITAEMDLGALKAETRGEAMPELRDPSKGLAAKTVQGLQEAIDAKMAGARLPGWSGEGTSPALDYLRAGRKATAQKYAVEKAYKGFGRDITELEPVGVFRGLTWEGDAGIQRLRQIERIAPESMPQVGRAFIEGGGNWRKLGPETKKILFKDPAVIKELDSLYENKARFEPLLKLEPVALAERLTRVKGRANELLTDVQRMAPEQMPGLGRSLLEGLLERSTREGNFQKIQSTLDRILDMDPYAKLLLFGTPERVNAIDNLFFAMKRLNREINPSKTAHVNVINQMKSRFLHGIGATGGALLGGAHGGGTGGAAGAAAGYAAGTAGEVLLNKGLARLLYDPRFSKLLTQGIRLQIKGDKAGVERTAAELRRVAAEVEPEPPEGPSGPPGAPPAAPGGGAAAAGAEAAPAGVGAVLREFVTGESGAFTPGRVLERYGREEARGTVEGYGEPRIPAVVGGPGGAVQEAAAPAAAAAAVTPKRPAPVPAVQEVTNAYNARRNLPPVDHSQYHPVDEPFQRRVADAYENLKEDNSADPKVRAAYEALVTETKEQWQHLIDSGYKLEPWTREGQPYKNSQEMVRDLQDNKHLYFYTGGEPHPFLGQVDPKTGLTINDMFRAIHDAYGHAGAGYGFGARGEEGAHDIHSQSFSPLARQAMTTETRGQNSWVNFGRHNYDAQGNPLRIPPGEKPYAVQKVDLLPEEFQVRASERMRQPAAEEGGIRGTLRAFLKSEEGSFPSKRLRRPAETETETDARKKIETADLVKRGAQLIHSGSARDLETFAGQMRAREGAAIEARIPELYEKAQAAAAQAGKDIKGRTMETLAVRIPDEQRVVSKDPSKTVDGKRFHELDLKQKGEGFLPLQKYGEEKANQMLDQALEESINESEAGGGTTARDAVKAIGLKPPDASFWDKSLKLPIRARYWYELSGESFTKEHFDIPREQQPRLIEVIAGTSGGAEPLQNMQRAIGLISETLQRGGTMTDVISQTSARKALDPETALETLKYGSFGGTMQLVAGLSKKPTLPTNDVQVGSMFGVTGEAIAKNPVVYEVISRFFMKLRDMQNAELGIAPPKAYRMEKDPATGEWKLPAGAQEQPTGVQPYETWQFQAPAWVYERARKNPAKASEYDDYAQVMTRDIIPALQAAGVPTPGGKITMETFLDPRTPNVTSGTRAIFMAAPVATVEVATEKTAAGKKAADTYRELQTMDQNIPWVRNAIERYQQYQINVMKALGTRTWIRQGATAEQIKELVPWESEKRIKELVGKAAERDVQLHSIVSDLMSAIVGRRIEVSRIETTGHGTFGNSINPNLRIPLVGRQSDQVWHNLTEVQQDAFLAYMGRHLHQKAMAANLFENARQGSEPAAGADRTFSIFMERYDGIADTKAILEFRNKIGFEVSTSQHANGIVLNINTGGTEARPVYEKVLELADETFGGDPAVKYLGVIPTDRTGRYLTEDKYGKAIYEHRKSGRAERTSARKAHDAGGVGGEGAAKPEPSDIERATAAIEIVARQREKASRAWNKAAQVKIQNIKAREARKAREAQEAAQRAARKALKKAG